MLFIISYIPIDRSHRVESNEVCFIIGTHGRMNSFRLHLIIPLPERFYEFYNLINYDIHNKLDINE